MNETFKYNLSKLRIFGVYLVFLLIRVISTEYDYYDGDFEGDYDEVTNMILANDTLDASSSKGRQ